MLQTKKQKGFTLVELLVVVAIIAILVLIAIPRFAGSTKGATVKTFEGNVRTLSSQIVQEIANKGGASLTDDDLKDTTELGKFVATLSGKPAGATYEITKFPILCSLDFDGKAGIDYEVEIDATGTITRKTPDASIKELSGVKFAY